jgi:hypothetical protein
MKGIPYNLIGEGLALVFLVMAFIEAEAKFRIVLVVSYLLTFLLSRLFPSATFYLICSISRLLIGVACFIYLKYHGYIGFR